MNCKKCNEPLGPDEKFCPNCGEKNPEYGTGGNSDTGEYAATGEYSTGGEYNASSSAAGEYNASGGVSLEKSNVDNYDSLDKNSSSGEYNATGAGEYSAFTNTGEEYNAAGTGGEYNAAGTGEEYNAAGTGGEYNAQSANTGAYNAGGANAFSSYAAEGGNQNPVKKKKGLKPVIIGVVAALAVAGVAFGAYKAVGGMFTSPKAAFRSAVKRDASSTVDFVGKAFDSAKAKYKKYAEGYGYEGDMVVELSDSGKEQLASALGEDDLDWFDKASLKCDGNVVSGSMDFNATLVLNDVDLLDMKLYMDEDMLQMQFPDLSDSVITYDVSTLNSLTGGTSLLDAVDMNARFAEAIPDSDQLKKVTDRYTEIVVNNINDVKKSSDEVSASGVTVKATKLTATITGEELLEIQKKVLEQIPEDEELKDIIVNGYDVYSEMSRLNYGVSLTGEEVYESFIDSVNEALENIEDEDEPEETLEYSIWLSGKNVIAKELVVDDEVIFDYRAPVKGTDIGVDFTIGSDYDSVRFSGAVKKNGSNITGDFVLESEGGELKIKSNKFDFKKLESGNADMDLEFSMDEYEGYSLGLKVSGDDKKAEAVIYLNEDGDSLGSLTVTSNIKDVNTPEELDGDEVDASDYMALFEYISDADFDTLKERLEEADVPEDYIGALDYFKN